MVIVIKGERESGRLKLQHGTGTGGKETRSEKSSATPGRMRSTRLSLLWFITVGSAGARVGPDSSVLIGMEMTTLATPPRVSF